ncbi:hypothetical protein KM176_16725 [Pseudooceanicola sp. CBS1P-1]|uniref:Uncharacterized protein n=1 Tax=Pseudooceanicola albus TaxID=2692189 RepID=A0A6L7G6D6_9RHOB|nr:MULTISPECIES: hypothetical protein [Pseudooceanicola]MBT9385520.1 hypothetical protein [Pseudooceanicola endophyticus]MXN19068.1 hypothetical protein [Pseudooceanicola albus]
MEWLIWIGTAISACGLAGLVWSIVRVARAKRAQLEDAELRIAIQKAMPLNMGGLFMSVIGLMMVILGISLS